MTSSSQPFVSFPHSAASARARGQRSRFTHKHLSLLSQSSTTGPLRVVAHVDLDAFYAQCEMVRLGVAADQPLAVRQWEGLIAVNYPARASGVTRFLGLKEARDKCPGLIVQHVATWKEGDDRWAYREHSERHVQSEKVSLDPYRLQSRRILATIRDVLPPPPLQRVEKASVDEVFLDLSAQIHSTLLQRYPELAGPPPCDDPSENLPRPPSTALDWQADALVDLDDGQTEDDDPDWDDVVMWIGSEIVRGMRKAIYERLGFTSSAGIARNKMMAKLGSGYKKPNSQTVVRNRAVQHFLSGFKFTKIRNLGGKLGHHVVSTFNTEELGELLQIPLEQLKSRLGDDTGTWVYNVIRGEDHSEVSCRTQIKSMLSAKSFRPSINSFEQAVKWLRIFVADIYARLVEEGVVENKRRPKTMNLHHRQGGQTRSRQIPIPMGKKIDENMLFELSKTLLGQVMADGRAWPCANLSLSVGGFEDGVAGNRGIGTFLVRGDEAKAMNISRPVSPEGQPEKRRKVEVGSNIQHISARQEIREEHGEGFDTNNEDEAVNRVQEEAVPSKLHQTAIASYFCHGCQKAVPEPERCEHEDWHFAKSLQTLDEPSTNDSASNRPQSRNADVKPTKRGSIRSRGRGGKVDKGQSRLAFG